MFRILIGSVLGGIVQFVIGALFWATPLGRLAFGQADETATATLQSALAQTLTQSGSATYFIPSPETAAGTTLLGKGPVALIHFNSHGFAPMNGGALLGGLILSIVMLVLIGLAVKALPDFATRLRALVLIAVATVLYFILSMPVYNFYMPWAWWIYLAVADFLAFVAGGFVLVRWFMPRDLPLHELQEPRS